MLKRAAAAGAVVALGYVFWTLGFPPLRAFLDAFLWIMLVFVGLFGAILGAGTVLGWRHVRQAPIWLLWTALGLLLLSSPIVLSFAEETRQVRAFYESADSVRGLVEGKFYRAGPRLRVVYGTGEEQHRLLTPGEPRHDRWTKGDSVWVYLQPAMPDSTRVDRLLPDPAPVLRSLAWLWGLGAVLFTAYAPPAVRFVRQLIATARHPGAYPPNAPESR